MNPGVGRRLDSEEDIELMRIPGNIIILVKCYKVEVSSILIQKLT